jgi:hypothetical protein
MSWNSTKVLFIQLVSFIHCESSNFYLTVYSPEVFLSVTAFHNISNPHTCHSLSFYLGDTVKHFNMGKAFCFSLLLLSIWWLDAVNSLGENIFIFISHHFYYDSKIRLFSPVSGIKLDEETSKVLQLERSFVWCLTRTLRKVDQTYLESFEMWCWRRKEKIIWSVHVRKEVLQESRMEEIFCVQ